MGEEPKETATKGRAGRNFFFVEQIAVEMMAQRAAEKMDPGEEGGRHRCAASAVSFSVKKKCRWAGGRSTATRLEEQTAGPSRWDPTEIVERWRLQLVDSTEVADHLRHRADYFRQPWERRPRCICNILFERVPQFYSIGTWAVDQPEAIWSQVGFCNA